MAVRDQRRRGGALRTFTAFGIGATVGSLIALLYAPASGTVTRRRMALRARNLRKAAVRRLGHTQRMLATRAGDMREAATEWITDHMPRYGNGRRAVHHS